MFNIRKRRIVKKFLFANKMFLPTGERYSQLVAVECYNLDHALQRLQERFLHSKRADWEMVEELDPEHFVGVLGVDMPLPAPGGDLFRKQ